MKASELRIGNLLEFSNGIQPNKTITVGRRFFSSASIEKEDSDFEITPYYRPIPISEEWLKKFGFDLVVKEGNQGEYRVYHLNEITYNTNQGWWWKHHLTVQPKYIHELQNLFFAITGRELSVVA